MPDRDCQINCRDLTTWQFHSPSNGHWRHAPLEKIERFCKRKHKLRTWCMAMVTPLLVYWRFNSFDQSSTRCYENQGVDFSYATFGQCQNAHRWGKMVTKTLIAKSVTVVSPILMHKRYPSLLLSRQNTISLSYPWISAIKTNFLSCISVDHGDQDPGGVCTLHGSHIEGLWQLPAANHRGSHVSHNWPEFSLRCHRWVLNAGV